MRLLREPLLHFLILGAGLFWLYDRVGGRGAPAPDEITVSAATIDALEEGWRRTWQRPPSDAEREALIEGWIREEILYREALALNLDRDDTIVRRRMRQKLEFLTDDVVGAWEPVETELRAFLAEHPERFRRPARLSFQQIFLSRDRHGLEGARQRAGRLLERLAGAGHDVDAEALGDPVSLPGQLADATEGAVARRFGSSFAERLLTLPVGAWVGPVESGHGLHLVRIRERVEPADPPLEEVREAVEREWRQLQRQQTADRFYRELRRRYSISIESADAGDVSASRLAGRRP